ncbi:hypothetical protein NP233_g799 [Leucocoprinus birnbaumii]|uniref:Uncharacterized protein n=1 Tax=Leucocoprinus birnbaumii TaxID=56174 RepID=A0AAD5W1K6_9AGAR|nr:hypothetical protein NP233_g799 [Leucocoprinus birnbaumii]
MLYWRSLCLTAALSGSGMLLASAKVVPFIEQSFYFDWNNPTQPFPVPVTQQCETIHITWERGTATGPNPVAPYTLQVYTSNYLVPFIISAGSALQFDWTVPFAPGSQVLQVHGLKLIHLTRHLDQSVPDLYVRLEWQHGRMPRSVYHDTEQLFVCALMHQRNCAGTFTGGCYSVEWPNVTIRCTDISILPRNGTPPYTLTIAPSLHPPYNLTGDGSQPMNWTVSLSWASSFFVSVVDSAGNLWSNGLLHSAEGTSSACLIGSASSKNGGVPTGAAVGAGIGGLGVGLIVGLLGAFVFFRFRSKGRTADIRVDLQGSSYPGSPQGAYLPATSLSSHYHALPTSAGAGDNALGLSTGSTSYGTRMSQLAPGSQYQVEPFVLPSVAEDPQQPSSPTHYASNPSLSSPPSVPESGATSREPGRQVYVVHHDGGRAPVTVYTHEGTQVVELPPGYPGGEPGSSSVAIPQSPTSRTGNDARSMAGSYFEAGSGSSDAGRTATQGELPTPLQQVRRPGNIRKPSGPKRPPT